MPGIVPALTHFDKPLRVPLGEISPLAAIGDHSVSRQDCFTR